MNIAEPTKLVSIDLEHILSIVDGPRPSKTPKEFLPTDTDAAWHSVNEAALTHINDQLLAQLDLDRGPLGSSEFGNQDAAESFWFAGAGGMRVQGFIVKPPGFDPGKKYPVKFLMHGGPQTAWGDAWSYRWNWELMAANGYVVIGINRRGSTGYGQKFVDEVSGDWGGRAYVDLMRGLDYAEATYPFLDKTRECALGASYGGFMADWVLTHTNRFKCVVTHDGLYDPVSAYGATEELWFSEWEFRRPEDFPKGWDGFSSDPTHREKAAMNGAPGIGDGRPAQPWRYASLPADEDPFRKWSPMRFIQNAKTPTLVIHSQRDYRLDVSEGFQLFTALQRMNVPSKMLYFPDEGHWVLKPQNSKLWYQTVGDWCDLWTKTNRYAVSSSYVPPTAIAPKAADSSSARMGQSRPTEMDETQPLPEPATRAAAPKAPAKTGKTTAVTPPPVAATPAAASPTKTIAPSQASANGADFTITLSAPDNEVQVGSDARVAITLTNMSDHQILFGHRPGANNPEFSYRIEVRNAGGHVVEATEYGSEAQQRQQMESRTVDYVQPGGTTVQTAHIAKLVVLTRPGRYTVQVSRRVGEKGVVVRSNELTLNVVP